MVATNREAIAKQTNKKVRITLAHTESYIYTYIYSYRLHDLNPRDKILSSSVQLETGHIKAKHILTCSYDCYYLRRRLASGEGIVTLGVCVYVCVSAEPRLHAALVSAAKVMRCIQYYLVVIVIIMSSI